jgi:transglutaminase-like putative cysteine protease
MSGRARLTVCAAAASVMAGFALLPLTASGGWFFTAVLLVCLQTGVGAAARRAPLARPLTILVQALVSLVVLTMMFAPHQALGGILPGPSAVRQLGQVVQDGMNDVSNFAIPAPVTPGIRILLIGGMVIVALTVDAIAVTYNSSAPAGLPLLALYSIAAGLATGGARWLYFLVAASGYLLLLLAEGRDRLSRWGRVFSSPPPAGGWAGGPASASAGGGAPARTGHRIGAMALGLALVAPALLPSLGSGLLDPSGHGNGNGLGGHGGGAVNLVAALQDNLNQPDNREVLSYTTDSKDVPGMYLRIAALDKFDGKEWLPSNQLTETVPSVLPRPQGMATDVKYKAVSTTVRVADSYVQGLLPMPFPALSVQTPGNWVYQPEGRMLIGKNGQTASGVHYAVTSMEVEPTAAQLAAARPATGRILQQYTQVPSSLPPVVKQIALHETRTATNDYEKAVDLQRYFTSGQFVYNTQAKAGTGVDAIARFLQTKQGFCVHFAFTMAAMARTLGIPARVAIGFTPGTQKADGTMSVGLKDAHAWPELYFEGIGWTRFEPTPYRGTAPSYTQTTPVGGGNNQSDQAPKTTVPTPTATPSATPSCAPENGAPAQGTCGQAAAATGGSGGGGIGGGQVALIALAALLVLLIPTGPAMWRSRLRAGRLGGGRDRPEGIALSAWREVVDTGWDYGVFPDDSETPRRAMARLVRDGQLSGEAATAAGALATAVEQTLYAPHPRPTPGLADDVHRVHAGLRASSTRSARLRAFLLPRSAARLGWAFTARWSAAANRTRALAAPLRRRATRSAS